jgi:SAM-dependent methyltransferase
MDEPYYRPDLARVHHEGFDFHAEMVAPGILHILEPVLARRGLVVEFGCGSGLLTRYLVDAGHRVVATDASPAMLDLARETVPGAEGFLEVRLPRDPLPPADAIVGVGHPISYLPSLEAIHEALIGMAGALRPGGILAFDICDLAWGEARRDDRSRGWVRDDWALVTEFSVPTPDRFVRQMAIFSKNPDGSWRRDDERHDNVLIDVTTVPPLLLAHGVEATIGTAFGDETMPQGLSTVVGRKAG